MGEKAVVALRDFPDDLDGVSDGSVMAKEACKKMESIVSFLVCDIAMARPTGILDLLTVCPATHDGSWWFSSEDFLKINGSVVCTSHAPGHGPRSQSFWLRGF
jgi:hypothetical protein